MQDLADAEAAGALPHLVPALYRLLEEYPHVRGGLSRSERQALLAVSGGPRRLAEAYPAAHHDVEDPIWMGDLTFAGIVDRLASAPTPLLAIEEDADDPRASMRRAMRITGDGREVLAGRADAVRMNGIDRWIGGVHLQGRAIPWRWDADAHRIAAG